MRSVFHNIGTAQVMCRSDGFDLVIAFICPGHSNYDRFSILCILDQFPSSRLPGDIDRLGMTSKSEQLPLVEIYRIPKLYSGVCQRFPKLHCVAFDDQFVSFSTSWTEEFGTNVHRWTSGWWKTRGGQNESTDGISELWDV